MASAMGMLSNMRGGASKDAMLRQVCSIHSAGQGLPGLTPAPAAGPDASGACATTDRFADGRGTITCSVDLSSANGSVASR